VEKINEESDCKKEKKKCKVKKLLLPLGHFLFRYNKTNKKSILVIPFWKKS